MQLYRAFLSIIKTRAYSDFLHCRRQQDKLTRTRFGAARWSAIELSSQQRLEAFFIHFVYVQEIFRNDGSQIESKHCTSIFCVDKARLQLIAVGSIARQVKSDGPRACGQSALSTSGAGCTVQRVDRVNSDFFKLSKIVHLLVQA